MRARFAGALVFAAVSLWASAATPTDGGGRDVSVALFSTHVVRAVTVTPIGSGTWVAQCLLCAHKPLTSPLRVSGPTELFAGGLLRVVDDASGEARVAAGLWRMRGRDGEVDVVLTLPSERYVAAVLNAEAARNEPAQSLRALAILARTYALNGTHFTAGPGHLPADLCDSTQCQAMQFGPVSPAITDATQSTAGETLWLAAHRAEVFFSQSCGGTTEDAGAVWPRLRGVPYLSSHADPYCFRRDTAAWHAEVPLAKLTDVARVEGWKLPANITEARVVQRSASHRALRIQFIGSGPVAIVSAGALRFGIGRALGWDRVRSDAYEAGVRNGALVFDGRGHGHGVGLCQQGAAEMAVEGKSAREILGFYFPGTAVGILPGDNGWREEHGGTLTLRAAQPVTADRKTTLERTWSETQRRFPPRQAITPQIVFAPTTEVFRQMTTQPGWALASTRDTTIVLQPDAVLHRNGRDPRTTLLHEMLHVLVEAEASERTPLWFREGLVEVLAGENVDTTGMSASEIDGALLRAQSLRESERAHRAAAACVHGLIERYGLSTLRGWLSAGVPPGVR